VLRKFENRKAFESAKRTRIYCSAVFDYSIALERAEANPAARLNAKGILRKRAAVVPRAAMRAAKIPDFLRKLAAANVHSSIRAALAFTVLTALRTGEVLELKWTDLTKDRRSLTIPAERMKGGRPHTVFLSKQAQAVLESIKEFSSGREHVFPGRNPRGPLSNMPC
jgi:integrase